MLSANRYKKRSEKEGFNAQVGERTSEGVTGKVIEHKNT